MDRAEQPPSEDEEGPAADLLRPVDNWEVHRANDSPYVHFMADLDPVSEVRNWAKGRGVSEWLGWDKIGLDYQGFATSPYLSSNVLGPVTSFLSDRAESPYSGVLGPVATSLLNDRTTESLRFATSPYFSGNVLGPAVPSLLNEYKAPDYLTGITYKTPDYLTSFNDKASGFLELTTSPYVSSSVFGSVVTSVVDDYRTPDYLTPITYKAPYALTTFNEHEAPDYLSPLFDRLTTTYSTDVFGSVTNSLFNDKASSPWSAVTPFLNEYKAPDYLTSFNEYKVPDYLTSFNDRVTSPFLSGNVLGPIVTSLLNDRTTVPLGYATSPYSAGVLESNTTFLVNEYEAPDYLTSFNKYKARDNFTFINDRASGLLELTKSPYLSGGVLGSTVFGLTNNGSKLWSSSSLNSIITSGSIDLQHQAWNLVTGLEDRLETLVTAKSWAADASAIAPKVRKRRRSSAITFESQTKALQEILSFQRNQSEQLEILLRNTEHQSVASQSHNETTLSLGKTADLVSLTVSTIQIALWLMPLGSGWNLSPDFVRHVLYVLTLLNLLNLAKGKK